MFIRNLPFCRESRSHRLAPIENREWVFGRC
jgi:hypothetical protein